MHEIHVHQIPLDDPLDEDKINDAERDDADHDDPHNTATSACIPNGCLAGA